MGKKEEKEKAWNEARDEVAEAYVLNGWVSHWRLRDRDCGGHWRQITERVWAKNKGGIANYWKKDGLLVLADHTRKEL